MPVQAKLFQSFLHVSMYKDPKPDYRKGREYLDEAYKEIECVTNDEEKCGYLIVAKCNEAFIAHKLADKTKTTKLEEEIQQLLLRKSDLSQACIDSVQAFALSRLGIHKYVESRSYFQKALKVQPQNTQWMYRMAVMIARRSHYVDGLAYTYEKKEERKWCKKILEIDKSHALAHVDLSYNYFLTNKKLAAKHANRAQELEPENPYILHKVGRVFRKLGQYERALDTLEKACISSKKSDVSRQMGLVYQDMYKEQVTMKVKGLKQHKQLEKPDRELLYKARDSFSQSILTNSRHTEAFLNRALIYAQLSDLQDARSKKKKALERAKRDFLNALGTSNQSRDKVLVRIQYALFLQNTCKDNEKASEFFKRAIHEAILDCLVQPVTRKEPQPRFIKALTKDLITAKAQYKNIMKTKVKSSDSETHSEGLKGLAWLYQSFGNHCEAKIQYEAYLCCETKHSDCDAIQGLVKSLIQLGHFEEAQKWIQKLKDLEQKHDAKQLKIECALVQGKDHLTHGNHILAKTFFRTAIESGSLDGCHHMVDILRKHPDDLSLEFRMDCAKILHCCEQNSDSVINTVDKMLNLEHHFHGRLRKRHMIMEQTILENMQRGITQDIVNEAYYTLSEARSMLDRAMFKFQQKHYPPPQGKKLKSYFKLIQHVSTTKPKTREQVETELLNTVINHYEWNKFDVRFQDLLHFLVMVSS